MKKVISLCLVLALITAMFTVSFSAYSVVDEDIPSAKEAIAAYEEEEGEEVETQRIYFQMPNGERGGVATQDVSVHRTVTDEETGDILDEYDEVVIHAGEKALTWYNDYNILAADGKHYAGVYWWDIGIADPLAWAGYRMEIDDYDEGIYYVDVPVDATTISINNGVDGGMDSSLPIYSMANQTTDLNVEGKEPGEVDTLPYGTPKYEDWLNDGCIFVIDPDLVTINELSNRQQCGGDWYVYYGNGCYGSYYEGCDEYVSPEVNCVNPDHHHGDDDDDKIDYDKLDLDSNLLYFDANTTGWEMGDKDKIGFYAFPLSDSVSSAFKSWGGKRLQGTNTGNGIWSFDPKNWKLEEGVQYKIIFFKADSTNAAVAQTYDLFFDTTCLGHVGYCDGTIYENPADSSKKTLAAFWSGKDAADYGPVLQISSIGNVVGTCLEQGKTATDIFSDFVTVVNTTTLKTGLDNAREFVVDVGTKTEQQLIDDIGTDLKLTKQDVYDVFTNNEIETTWDHKVSTLPGSVAEDHTHTPGEPVQENVKDATCTEEGSYDEVVRCTECGEEISRETKTIPAKGHTPAAAVRENEIPATCTAAGSYDEVVYCSVCHAELSRETKTIKKLSHTMKSVARVEPTYESDGVKAHFVCTVCGKMFAEPYAVHEYTAEDVIIPKLVKDPQGLCGDVDSSGEVDVVDVTVIQRIDAKIITADATMQKLGDVNGDGTVDIIDATLIQRWLVGLEQTRGIGKDISEL